MKRTGQQRRPGWFQCPVDADTARDLENVDREDDWPSSAYLAARTCIDGEPLNADRVTLYRGSLSQTRSWDGVRQQWIAEESFIGGDLVVQGGIIGEHIAADAIGAREIRANSIYLRAGNITGRLEAYQINATYLQVNAANVTGKLTAVQIETDELTVNSGNIKGILQSIQLTNDVKNVVRFKTFATSFYDASFGGSFRGTTLNQLSTTSWRNLLRRSASEDIKIGDYEYIQFTVQEWRQDFVESSKKYVLQRLVLWRINDSKSGGRSSQDTNNLVFGQYVSRTQSGWNAGVFRPNDVIFEVVYYEQAGVEWIDIRRRTAYAPDRQHWVASILDITGIKGLEV